MAMRVGIFRALNRMLAHSITVSPTAVTLDWSGSSSGENVDVYVTPDTMSWTVTKVDTGDGTSWFKVAPSTGTGDSTITITPFSDNTTGSTRSAKARVTDDSDSTVYADITVNQITKPE